MRTLIYTMVTTTPNMEARDLMRTMKSHFRSPAEALDDGYMLVAEPRNQGDGTYYWLLQKQYPDDPEIEAKAAIKELSTKSQLNILSWLTKRLQQ